MAATVSIAQRLASSPKPPRWPGCRPAAPNTHRWTTLTTQEVDAILLDHWLPGPAGTELIVPWSFLGGVACFVLALLCFLVETLLATHALDFGRRDP